MNTAKNILGESVEILPLRFEFNFPHLCVFRGKEFYCNVIPNGWQGDYIFLQHPIAEPILHNINHVLSFKEMEQIMAEYWKNATREQIEQFVQERRKAAKALKNPTV
jgi:hypothetical protein